MIILAIIIYLVTSSLNFYLFYKWVGKILILELILSILCPPIALIATLMVYSPDYVIKLRKK